MSFRKAARLDDDNLGRRDDWSRRWRLVRAGTRRQHLTPFNPAYTDGDSAFHALLESAPDAMVITDTTGTMVSVNSQTETMFGYSREELLGQPIVMLVPGPLRPQAPERVYGLHKTGERFPVDSCTCATVS